MGKQTRASTSALNGIILRSATAADIPEVAALEQVCYSDPWPASAFDALPGNERIFFAVALQGDGLVVGYVVAWYVLDEAELANLAVAPPARGRGVGTVLLDSMLRDAEDRGITSIYLEVRRSNAGALKLYRSRGFEQVGMRKQYYRTPAEDALILRYTLKR